MGVKKATGKVSTPKQSEANFQKQVLALAKLYGWKSAHFRPAKTSSGNWITAVQGDGKGFPDLVLVRDGRLIFAELKSETGVVSDEQEDWLEKLETVQGIVVEVWRPEDWDQIVELLKPQGG